MGAGGDVHDVGALAGAELREFGFLVRGLYFLIGKFPVLPDADIPFSYFKEKGMVYGRLEFNQTNFILLGHAAIDRSRPFVYSAIRPDIAVLGLQ